MTVRPHPVVRLTFALVALASPFVMGCGGKKFHQRAPVSGKVTIAGKPLPGGIITFSREEDARDTAIVYVRGDGTYETKSAPVGKCKVSVATSHLNPAPPTAAPKPGDPPAQLPKPPDYWVSMSGDPKTGKVFMPIPKKYESLDESGLTFEVKDGTNTYDIPLADK